MDQKLDQKFQKSNEKIIEIFKKIIRVEKLEDLITELVNLDVASFLNKYYSTIIESYSNNLITIDDLAVLFSEFSKIANLTDDYELKINQLNAVNTLGRIIEGIRIEYRRVKNLENDIVTES